METLRGIRDKNKALWIISKHKDVRNIPVRSNQFRFKSPSCALYLFRPRRSISKNIIARQPTGYDYESDQYKTQQISSPFNLEGYKGPKPPASNLAPTGSPTTAHLDKISPNTSLNQDSKCRPSNMPKLMITPGHTPWSNTAAK